MSHGICALSIVPVRREPADPSEMINQLLFGEHYDVLEEHEKWVKIRGALDQYEGWIDRKQHLPISEKQHAQLQSKNLAPRVTDFATVVENKELNDLQPIVLGSSLPMLSDTGETEVGSLQYLYKGRVIKGPQKDSKQLLEFAFMYLNAPYLWGGRSPLGIDCSGFTQMVYKLIGVSLPRDAYQQAGIGETLSFVEEARPGDLAFFDNAEGKIIHVGIILEDHYIIHASGKVRVDRVDHEGIFNEELKTYTHRLRLIKRLIK